MSAPVLAPATVAEGPLEREAYHIWNGFALNVLQGQLPRWVIKGSIDGLRDRPDADSTSAPLTGQDGEVLYPSVLRGKTVTYDGKLYAATLPELRVQTTAFLASFVPNGLGIMAITPPVERGGVSWAYIGRVLSATCREVPNLSEHTRPSPWQADWDVAIRMPRPVFVEQTTRTQSGSVTCTADNLGTAPAYPVFYINHDGGDLNVLNLTHGKALRFNDVPAGAVVIDFASRSALSDSDDIAVLLDDANSDWWDEGVPGMPPGINQFKQEGALSIEVQYHHTSY